MKKYKNMENIKYFLIILKNNKKEFKTLGLDKKHQF